jgi:hypothetical protein
MSINDDKQIAIKTATNKRVLKEIQRMKEIYDSIDLEYVEDNNMIVSLQKKHNNYKFYIPINYPFETPMLDINGLNQQAFFKIRSSRLKTALKQISGLDCLCCNTHLCKGNWCPSTTMDQVIKQIEDFQRFKYLTIVKILLDKIKEQYFNGDIELESWLFIY